MTTRRPDPDIMLLAEAVQRLAGVVESMNPTGAYHIWAKEARTAAEQVMVRRAVGEDEARRLAPGPVAGTVCREGYVTEFLEPSACATLSVGGVVVLLSRSEAERVAAGMLAGHRVQVERKG